MIKVFILAKHPVTRRGLASLLEVCAGYQVVGDANNTQDALSQIGELKPDVVIMDIISGNSDNIKDITMIQKKYDKAKILILTDSNGENDFLKAIGAGVRGYLLKSSEVSQLVDSIRLVAADDAVIYSTQITEIFDSTRREANRLNQLSQREKEILQLVAQGHSNRDIANLCFISQATVKSHMRRIMEKLDVKNRAGAVAIAMEKGLLKINCQ